MPHSGCLAFHGVNPIKKKLSLDFQSTVAAKANISFAEINLCEIMFSILRMSLGVGGTDGFFGYVLKLWWPNVFVVLNII